LLNVITPDNPLFIQQAIIITILTAQICPNNLTLSINLKSVFIKKMPQASVRENLWHLLFNS